MLASGDRSQMHTQAFPLSAQAHVIIGVLVLGVAILAECFGWVRVLYMWGPVALLPAAFLIERLVGRSPSRQVEQPTSSRIQGYAAIVGLSILPAAVAAMAAQVPPPPASLVWAPFPWLVVLPEFLHVPGCVVAAGTFIILNMYQARAPCPAPIPTRFTVVLAATTVLSWIWLRHVVHRVTANVPLEYLWVLAAINLCWIVLLWGLWFYLRGQASRLGAMVFALLLHCWLFWHAFPTFGPLE